ncbi:MAG: pilus assembly protein [Planctomycetales bacterium]|nr:pilus assembly protein [Planctomycetales bacterium]
MPSNARARKRRGAVTVEFALVSIVFFTFVFGMIEFSRLNILRHAADNASYEGARVGIVPGASVDDVKAAAQNQLDILRVNTSTVVVTPDPLTTAADSVTVTVTVPVAENSWLVPRFSDGLSMESSTTLGTERYRGIPTN